MSVELKPCPWCGDSLVAGRVVEGDTFRWRRVQGCCADGPEVRHDTLADDQAAAEADSQRRAIEAWNTRATKPPAVGVDVSEEMSEAWRECYSATIKALAVMVTAGAPESVDKWDVVDRSAITGQVIKIREAMDKFNKPFLTAALRTGGGE